MANKAPPPNLIPVNLSGLDDSSSLDDLSGHNDLSSHKTSLPTPTPVYLSDLDGTADPEDKLPDLDRGSEINDSLSSSEDKLTDLDGGFEFNDNDNGNGNDNDNYFDESDLQKLIETVGPIPGADA